MKDNVEDIEAWRTYLAAQRALVAEAIEDDEDDGPAGCGCPTECWGGDDE